LLAAHFKTTNFINQLLAQACLVIVRNRVANLRYRVKQRVGGGHQRVISPRPQHRHHGR
jgi:hypothetical protein